ncbi:protein phosphatase regulator [Linderina pennispora]|nr:protein phosphatase regulator [Linderina pennispora]
MGDSTSHDELIAQWLQVNPGTEDQARFYLEANNWDLNAALSNFYEEPPLSEGLPAQNQGDLALPQDPTHSAAAPVISAQTLGGGPIHAASSDTPPSNSAASSVPRRRYGSGSRIATLSSLGDEAENDDDSQDWYAGGERSGMAVRPPPRSGDSNDEGGSLVDRILRRAAEGGAPPEPAAQPSEAGFSGRGRALGGADDDEYQPSEPSETEDDVAVRQLTFWRNGFSIGDGPLYNTEDPRNRQNLEAILQGRAPLDILNVRPGQQVEMRVVKRTGEDYTPPPSAPPQPFSGQGHRLGGISPPVTAAPASGGLFHRRTSSSSAKAAAPITLDPSQRTVQVQIRMADGTRIVAKVNPSHTIGDLRAYVLHERPAASARPFNFKTMMPPKVLDNDSATVEEAGIANAAIAQHFI